MGLMEAHHWLLGHSAGSGVAPLDMEAQRGPPGRGVWLWGWASGHWVEVFPPRRVAANAWVYAWKPGTCSGGGALAQGGETLAAGACCQLLRHELVAEAQRRPLECGAGVGVETYVAGTRSLLPRWGVGC